MNKSLIFTFFAFILCLGARAQQDTFTADHLPSIERDEDLGGQGGMLVYSPHDDIVVSIQPTTSAIRVGRPTRTDNGLYEYEVKVDIAQTTDIVFNFSRKGSALKASLKKNLRRNHWFACRVEAVATPIQCVEQTGTNKFSGKDGVAIVEFSSSLSNLSIRPSDKLKCSVKSEPSTSDASITITRISIDGNAFKKAKDEEKATAEEFRKLDTQLTQPDYKGTDEEWDRLDKLKAQSEEQAALVAQMRWIEVSTPSSNTLSIDILDLGTKERRAYAIEAIGETFEMLLNTARKYWEDYASHHAFAYYDAAVTAYDKVRDHPDCPWDLRDQINMERDTLGSIRRCFYMAEEAGRRADAAEANQGFESADVYKYLAGRARNLDKICAYHPEIEGVEDMCKEAWNKLKKHPNAKETVRTKVTKSRQVVTGTVTMSNGESPKRNVYVSLTQDVSKKDARKNAKLVGTVKEDGSFSVIIPDGYDYIYVSGEQDAHRITPGMGPLNINF